jgi:hypothetical protein
VRESHGITVGSSKSAERPRRRGNPLVFWGMGVDVLVGAVVIAGITFATLKLHLLKYG